MRIAHIAFDFGFRSKRGYRVDHDKVNRSASYEIVGNVESLFARIGLRYVQIFEVYAEFSRINGVERVFRVDKRRYAAHFLSFGYDVQRDGRFARRFGSVNFDYSSARNAAYAEREIER